MPWVRRNLRGTTVFVRTKGDGTLDVGSDGRVDVRYKEEEGAKVYRASERNLAPVAPAADAPPPAPIVERRAAPPPKAMTPPVHGAPIHGRSVSEPIIIYTDGACSRNPGPMGIGVVIVRGAERQEIGEYLGIGTNNIAELTAIERALDALTSAERARKILLHADSAYAIGVVTGEMKPKKNLELVARIRAKARAFPHLSFVKVRGHAGVVENERCDELATGAIESSRRSVRVQ